MAALLEESYGYWCQASRGSRGIDVTGLAAPDSFLPHVAIEAGTRSKSVKQAFAKLRQAKLYPGMIPLVVRKVKKKNRIHLRWHATDGKWGHDSFEKALEEARSL